MGHIHAAAMAEYAKDATETDMPWERWESSYQNQGYESLLGHPLWTADVKYRRKPKVILINGHEVPEALRLAHALSGGKLIDDSTEWADTLHGAAAKLHRQHARIAELEDVADMAIKRIAELEAAQAERFEATDPTDSFWVEVCRAFEGASVTGITQEKQG